MSKRSKPVRKQAVLADTQRSIKSDNASTIALASRSAPQGKGSSVVSEVVHQGAHQPHEPNEIESSTIHLLHRAVQCAGEVFTEEMAALEITPRQYAVLVTVAEHEGLSQTGLVEKTGIDRSTLADIIRRMLKKGLIQRKRTREDARAYAVRLTPKGENLLKAAKPVAHNADRFLLDALPQGKRSEFLQNLQIIIDTVTHDEPKNVH